MRSTTTWGLGMYGARSSDPKSCAGADQTTANATPRRDARIASLGRRTRFFPPYSKFYYTRHDFGPGAPKIRGAADCKLRALEELYRVADGVAPRIRLRVEIVVHVEDRVFHLADLLQTVLRNVRIQHHFGAGEDQGVGALLRVLHLLIDQVGEELGIAVLLAEPLQIDGTQLKRAEGVAKRREIDLFRRFLPVQYSLLLHIERDD